MRTKRLRLHDETENIDWNLTVEFEEYHLLCPQSYHLLLTLKRSKKWLREIKHSLQNVP